LNNRSPDEHGFADVAQQFEAKGDTYYWHCRAS
jgi:hypothetical protein